MVNLNDRRFVSSREFLCTAEWQRKRAEILRRDKYLCRHCLRYGRRRDADQVHHIVARAEAPELALTSNNLVSLCSACHTKIEKGGRR